MVFAGGAVLVSLDLFLRQSAARFFSCICASAFVYACGLIRLFIPVLISTTSYMHRNSNESGLVVVSIILGIAVGLIVKGLLEFVLKLLFTISPSLDDSLPETISQPPQADEVE